MSVVSAKDLRVGYDGRAVASIRELSIAKGDRVAITGANGSGKTTLLKTLARLIPPVGGELQTPRRGIGGAVYVHPSPFVFSGTGASNVMLGAHGDHGAARSAIDRMGAASFADLDVKTLSHGQRQRIALARALAARPILLLVDEPETGLDAEGLEAWRRVLASFEGALVTASPESRIQTSEHRIQKIVLTSGF
jgi:zinc transport system ATP-binding protein